MPVNSRLWDVARYYLGTSYDRRSKYSGPFPTSDRALTGTRPGLNEFSEVPWSSSTGTGWDGMVYIENPNDGSSRNLRL